MKHFLPAGKPQTSRRLSLWLNALVVLLTPISLFVVTLMLIEPNPYCNSLRFSEDRIRCVMRMVGAQGSSILPLAMIDLILVAAVVAIGIRYNVRSGGGPSEPSK